MKKDHPKKILSQLTNLKKSPIKKNFMVIKNSDNYYINAVCNNLKPFEDLKKEIFESGCR